MATFDVDLSGIVAVVTGASRGAGRGTALVLGEAGATVYVTARSVRDRPSAPGREGSVEETAEAVAARGGTAIPVACDHTDDDAVRALFERVRAEQGRLDILVNNAWGGYEQRADQPEVGFFGVPFWEQPLWRWDAMFTAGVRAHLLTAQHAVPVMLEQRERPGLVVSTIAWAYGAYLGSVLYDTAKASTIRMVYGMGEDLRGHRIAAVALAPGHLGVNESREYLGRAIATLATAPDLMAKTGQQFAVGDLAKEYGFTDVDGTQPEPFRLD